MRSALDLTIARRAREFRGVFSGETIARYEESFVQVGGRPTVGPNFLPVMIERFFRGRLWAVARSQGKVEKAPPEVCPGYPGKRYQDWPVGDRAGRPFEVVRRNRYELYRRSGSCWKRSRRVRASDRVPTYRESKLDRVAVITDIHGNLPALEASLEAIDAIGVEQIYCGGDLVGYGPHPNEVCAVIEGRKIATIYGNYD